MKYADYEEALEAFKQAMISKFILRDAKFGDNSITRKHILEVEPTPEGLLEHWQEETMEVEADPLDRSEYVDHSNLDFLLWWHLEETS